MNHRDAELSDVVVVLQDLDDKQADQAVAQLKSAGLDVASVNKDNGTIEGCVETCKVPDLKHIPGVSYVRSVMTYTADYPPGDPRDKDGPEQDFEDGED